LKNFGAHPGPPKIGGNFAIGFKSTKMTCKYGVMKILQKHGPQDRGYHPPMTFGSPGHKAHEIFVQPEIFHVS
jgi:hypothetical protein